MHHSPHRLTRAVLALCMSLLLALYGIPAFAHDRHGGEAEAEVDGLEVEARPAIAKAGHPVLIKAEFEADDDDSDDADDESEDESDDADDADDADEDADESEEDESEEDESDDDESDPQSVTLMRQGDDDDDEEAEEEDEAEDEDDADDVCDDDSDEADDSDDADDDESDDDADDDDADDADDDESDDCDADDADEADEIEDDEACEDDESDDDADESDEDADESDDDESDLQRRGRGRGGDCAAAPELSTVLTVDFGDGSAAEPMESRGHGKHKAKGHAQHVFAEEGVYDVTVTAALADGTSVAATVSVQVGKGAGRLSGRDRFETGTELSNEAFPEEGSAPAVVLARADGFADALASATLATLRKAPVLLTSTADLPASVLEELQRVLVEGGTVFVLGGESAISADVESQLEGLGYVVERISGTDRIATALRVAEALQDLGVDFDKVVLANAGNFPDALSGAAHAARHRAPVLLTSGETLDPRVRDFLAGLDDVKVLVAGGPSVISDAIVAELEAMGLDVDRKGGKNRYATSAVIAADEFPDATSVVIATGKSFPDALAGAAHAGRLEAPVLLVGDELPEEVRAYLEAGAGRINVVYVIGGPNAVSHDVMDEIMEILGL